MLTLFPNSIKAGLSLKLDLVLAEYPAPDWSIKVLMRGPASIDIDAVAAGTGHLVTKTGVETANWGGGVYAVSMRAYRGDDVVEIEEGQTTVGDDIAGLDAGHDPLGHAQKTLAAVEAVIEGRATKDQESYTIQGRSLTRTSIPDLLLLRDTYRAEVKSLGLAAPGTSLSGPGKLLRRKIKVRFADV